MRLMLIVLALLFAMPAVAATISPEDVLDDPQQEARAQAMAERLRCVVCANQSIADSEASLAIDMQRLIRRRIAAGDSDQAILDDLIARYGERILLNPPMTTRTIILWSLPPALLVLVGLVLFLRKRASEAPALEAIAIDDWQEPSS